MKENQKFINANKIADRMGLSSVTVRSWCAKGCPHYRTQDDGAIRFIWEEVIEWLKKGDRTGQTGGNGKR